MQDPGTSPNRQRRTMTARIDAITARLHTDELHLLVADKRSKHAHRVRASANTRNYPRRQSPLTLEHLLAGLTTDHPLQVSQKRRIRRRAHYRADHIVGVLYVRHPIADRL